MTSSTGTGRHHVGCVTAIAPLALPWSCFAQSRGERAASNLEMTFTGPLARYHLSAPSIYRAIDQEENRNRRHTSPALIAWKLKRCALRGTRDGTCDRAVGNLRNGGVI